MLPADPENKSISLPVLSFVELSSIGSLPLAPNAAGPVVANFIAQVVAKTVRAGPYVAIPFMVSGLYGIVPYFLLDIKKVLGALEAVLKSIISALMVAWLAYQASKGFKRPPSLEGIVVGLVLFVLLVAIIAVIIATLPESLLVVGALAAVVLVIVVVSKTGSEAPPGSDNLNIHLGALHAFGLTSNQFASWMANAIDLFAGIWNVSPSSGTVNVTPLP
jgi:hypothetical protein